MVYRGDQCASLQHRVHDAGIERFVGITLVLRFPVPGGQPLRPLAFQCLMPGLVQQVSTAQPDKEHLQQRITDKQARHDARHRQQVVLQAQRLRFSREGTQQDVRKHGHDIAEVAGDVAQIVQPHRPDQSVPSAFIGLGGLCLRAFRPDSGSCITADILVM